MPIRFPAGQTRRFDMPRLAGPPKEESNLPTHETSLPSHCRGIILQLHRDLTPYHPRSRSKTRSRAPFWRKILVTLRTTTRPDVDQHNPPILAAAPSPTRLPGQLAASPKSQMFGTQLYPQGWEGGTQRVLEKHPALDSWLRWRSEKSSAISHQQPKK